MSIGQLFVKQNVILILIMPLYSIPKSTHLINTQHMTDIQPMVDRHLMMVDDG